MSRYKDHHSTLSAWGNIKRPCPLCGGHTQWLQRINNHLGNGIYGVLVRCECGTGSLAFYTSNGAAKDWNKK